VAQKMAKSLPKRAGREHGKVYRAAAWKRGEERKTVRVKEQEKRHDANKKLAATDGEVMLAGRILPASRRVRFGREDAARFRICLRCTRRKIVKGQVCWCQKIGEAS
jgi:hypothetical protein